MTAQPVTTSLAAWLSAQLDADEAVAREAASVFVGGAWHKGPFPDDQPVHVLTHIARHDPARVLADVVAKRMIVELWISAEREAEKSTGEFRRILSANALGLETAVRRLALPYAGAPGWDERWRP